MLVISRRIGESFLIGEDVEATIVDITGSKVVLGLSAPKSVTITRIQLTEISEENRQAGSSSNRLDLKGFAQMLGQTLQDSAEKDDK